jgi:hypothetical protein
MTQERLTEIEERIKTAYYWNVLAVPSLVVDEDMEWLIEEVERLREVLRHIQVWDCLNPRDPKLCADHPWLKRLVDEALVGEDWR